MPKIKNILPATEVRTNFFKILENIEKTNISITITVNGRSRAVMISPKEYDSLVEALGIRQPKSSLLKLK